LSRILFTDVLVVGSGPAGSATAALLSTYGVANIQISRFGWLADTPRAHITNQRAMEVLRDLGLEERAKTCSTHQTLMANNVFCYSLKGEEFGRVLSWGNHPLRKADYELASPTAICDLPQTFLEPILLEAAASRGTSVRFNTELIDLIQDADGVTATVKDRQSGENYPIRCKYLVGADGARSRIAELIKLPMEGQMGLSGSMNIHFDADLSRFVAHRPSVLYWILQPGSNIDGIGAGVMRMVRPWNEWLAIWGYDIGPGERRLGDDEAKQILHKMIGVDDIPIKIRSISTWTVNNQYATRYSNGRVFCMGDAVHRHPPLNGLGSNTSIQDAYNLAWKLKLVIENKAAPSLLETYDDERSPVGKQIVTRANRSIEDYPPIFDALGMLAAKDPQEALAAIQSRKAPDETGKSRRRKLNEAIRQKNYEFNAHGVELNQRYQSSAVVPDGTPQPPYRRDRELYYQATTWPGAHLPHFWVEQDGERKSTLDLCGQGRFTVLTGLGGAVWRRAAAEAERRFGISVAVVSIGPSGCDALDIYADWYWNCEIEEDGCVLVRPDNYVGWRSHCASTDSESRLLEVFGRMLGLREKLVELAACGIREPA
jgi:2,4-dichlorophenol 6-monooxygenase